MKLYLLSVYQPDGDPPPPEFLEPIMREVHALQEELKAAGAWVFSGGHAPGTATVLRVKDGDVVTTDGPYIEGKEHIGGFTEIAGAEEALAIVDRLDLDGYYLFHAIRADLLKRLGRYPEAAAAYDAAIARTANAAERAFLQRGRDALRTVH